jgi:hypothetical protein
VPETSIILSFCIFLVNNKWKSASSKSKYKFSSDFLIQPNLKTKMASCKVCLKSINKNQAKIACGDCNATHHGSCVSLTKDDIAYYISEKQPWRCAQCSSERRKSLRLETALDEGNVSLADVVKMLEEAKAERKMLEKELGKSLNESHEKIDENNKIIQEQAKMLQELTLSIEKERAENKKLLARIEKLEERLDESEQYSRRNAVEIFGIPQREDENVIEVIQKVGDAIGMPISETMVDACHRLGKGKSQNQAPGIIVKFVRRIDKAQFMIKKKLAKDLSTAKLGLSVTRPIYINDSLTKRRRELLSAARQAKREHGFAFVWTREGRILVRKSETGPVVEIKNMDDLRKL